MRISKHAEPGAPRSDQPSVLTSKKRLPRGSIGDPVIRELTALLTFSNAGSVNSRYIENSGLFFGRKLEIYGPTIPVVTTSQ
jgi:hypothetical protein